MMGCFHLAHHAAILLPLLPLLVSIAGSGDPSDETRPQTVEREALLAFRRSLAGSRLLDRSWVGVPCSLPNHTTWHGVRCSSGRVTSVSLEGLGLSGRISADALANLTDLSSFSLRNNSISGIMMDFSFNPGVTSIDLSENFFSGSISGSLFQLPQLSSLQLQRNYFTGAIPPLAQLSLTAFNVSYNNLTGEIPPTAALRLFSFSSYQGNPGLCGLPTNATCPTTTFVAPPVPAVGEQNKGGGLAKSPLLMAFVALDVIVLVVLMALVYTYHNKLKAYKAAGKERGTVEEPAHQQRAEPAAKEEACSKSLHAEEPSAPAVAGEGDGGTVAFMEGVGSFDVRDLLKSSAENLGRGSFGTCYKVMLDGDQAVVVKRLRDIAPLTNGEFEQRVRLLSGKKHPNLLPVLGFYYSREEKLLLLHCAPHGNLFDRIHGIGGARRVPFRWNDRLQVAQGVARAMEFLHLNAEGPDAIPHGHLISSNVLLGKNHAALVSDYGLASLIAPSAATQRMVVYKSPEYHHRRQVSRKSDVWSYGCLLLELITGRVSGHSAPRGIRGVELSSWVRRAVREEWTGEVFDTEVAGGQRGATQGMVRLLQVAIRCCEWQPEKRPEMREVRREVEGIRANNSDEEGEDSSDDISSSSGRQE